MTTSSVGQLHARFHVPSSHALAAGVLAGAAVVGGALVGPGSPLVEAGCGVAVAALGARAVARACHHAPRLPLRMVLARAARATGRRPLLARLLVVASGHGERDDWKAAGTELAKAGAKKTATACLATVMDAVAPPVAVVSHAVAALTSAIETAAFVGDLERAARFHAAA